MSSRCAAIGRSLAWRGALCLAIYGSVCAPLWSEPLYRYRDAVGAWVYSDRPPAVSGAVETLDFGTADHTVAVAEVTVIRQPTNAGTMLIAHNSYHSHVQMAFNIARRTNVDEATPTRGNRVLPPLSDTPLVDVLSQDSSLPMSFELSFQYIPGEPGARHDPPLPYRLPFAVASSFPVSQAYPQAQTHSDAGSRDAIDFVMPSGTGVYAARAGTVIHIANDFFESGQDIDNDINRANLVRILHDDGTMALYGHLYWNSIRVRPGQRVARGEYIADSGNTGYSSGPHLHFVVQRNVGGAIESVPVLFAGPGGRPIQVATGDIVTAY